MGSSRQLSAREVVDSAGRIKRQGGRCSFSGRRNGESVSRRMSTQDLKVG
jgi:hypothetical protein